MKPGITGWWQVTDRNDTDFDGMVRRDLEYIAKRGVATDLKIVALTVVEMITGGVPIVLSTGQCCFRD